MKYCDYCKVHVRTDTHQCPLCKNLIKGEGDGSEEVSYPPYSPLRRKRHLISRIFGFIVICAVCAFILGNVYTYQQGNKLLWSILAISGLLYLWLLVQFTCMTRINLGVKLLVHAVCIPALLIVINVVTNLHFKLSSNAVSWALSYATPFIIMAFVIAITITVAVAPMRWRDYTLYQFSIALIGFVPLVLMLIVQRFLPGMPLWPSLVAAVYSLLTLISMFLFMDKRTKTELRKRFHLK